MTPSHPPTPWAFPNRSLRHIRVAASPKTAAGRGYVLPETPLELIPDFVLTFSSIASNRPGKRYATDPEGCCRWVASLAKEQDNVSQGTWRQEGKGLGRLRELWQEQAWSFPGRRLCLLELRTSDPTRGRETMSRDYLPELRVPDGPSRIGDEG